MKAPGRSLARLRNVRFSWVLCYRSRVFATFEIGTDIGRSEVHTFYRYTRGFNTRLLAMR